MLKRKNGDRVAGNCNHQHQHCCDGRGRRLAAGTEEQVKDVVKSSEKTSKADRKTAQKSTKATGEGIRSPMPPTQSCSSSFHCCCRLFVLGRSGTTSSLPENFIPKIKLSAFSSRLHRGQEFTSQLVARVLPRPSRRCSSPLSCCLPTKLAKPTVSCDLLLWTEVDEKFVCSGAEKQQLCSAEDINQCCFARGVVILPC